MSAVDVPASVGSTSGTPRLRRNAVGSPARSSCRRPSWGRRSRRSSTRSSRRRSRVQATPFVYLACLIAILVAASGIIEMARELPSAGAFYTYVTRGLGPRAGFVTGGLMFVAYALLPPAEIGLIGSYLQSTLRTEADINVPWWLIGMVPAVRDDRARARGHPGVAAHRADPVRHRGVRRRACWRSSSSGTAAGTA